MNKLKYLLFLLIIFIVPNAYCLDYSVGSIITSPSCSGSSCTGGHYSGTEIYNTGTTNTYSINTRYNGRLSRIRYNLPLPSNWPDGDCFSIGDITYTITMNMATNDWRNRFTTPFVSSSSSGTNWATTSVTYVSYQKIYFSFKIPSSVTTCLDFIYVDLKSTNVSSTAFTGESNWNLSSITLSTNGTGTSGGSSGGGSSPTPTPTPNNGSQDIIDNANQNTTDIIDNANQNTQQIIDNQNELLGNKCANLFNSTLELGTYDSFGSKSSSNANYRNVSYVSVQPNTTYTFSINGVSQKYVILYYTDNNTFISQDTSLTNGTFTTPSNCHYINFRSFSADFNSNYSSLKLQLQTGSTPTPYCEYGSYSSKIDNIESSINNDNIDNNVGSDFFDSFTNNMHGLSSIITLPLSTIQSLTNSQCTPLTLPIPFTGKNITLPCMTEIYQQHVPVLLTLLRTCWLGIISYMALVDIFAMVKGFKDPDSDKIEVMEL